MGTGIRSIHRTAVYGPVRTVVWEGRSREVPPYPDRRNPGNRASVALWVTHKRVQGDPGAPVFALRSRTPRWQGTISRNQNVEGPVRWSVLNAGASSALFRSSNQLQLTVGYGTRISNSANTNAASEPASAFLSHAVEMWCPRTAE